MKLYKCQHCKAAKPADQFYSNSGRASPYCIECNSEAVRINKYRSEARQDPKAFAIKLRKKETQLDQMVKALREVRV